MNEKKKRRMNKRKLIAAFAVILASCTPDTEDVFGESAANRVALSQNSYSALLESQQQGWALDYYPSDGTLGGVAYAARFHGGLVTMSCEQTVSNPVTAKTYPVGTEATSYYQVTGETGVLLTFDTYNPLFHYWSQPSAGRAKGYQSDYEFTFLAASADSVVLRGKKHGNLLRMYPLAEAPAAYVRRVQQTHAVLGSIIRKRALVNGVSKSITMAYNQFSYTEQAKGDTVPYIHTADGVRFYRTVTLGGVNISRLTYDSSANALRSPDGRVVLPAPTVAESFAGGQTQWYFGYSEADGPTEMCSELADLLSDCAQRIKKPNWGYEVLQDFYIGGNLFSGDALHTVIGWRAADNYGKGNPAYFAYGISMDLVDEQRQLVGIHALEPATNFDKHVYCQSLVDFIGQHSPYQLVFDNDESPTSVTLTSEHDATKWFTLRIR